MSKHTFLRLVRVVARFVLGIIARIEIIGSINYQTGGFIITGNHVGRLEAFLVILLAERDDIVLILAEKYKQYAFWRYVARKVDGIWINRFDADFAAPVSYTHLDVYKRQGLGAVMQLGDGAAARLAAGRTRPGARRGYDPGLSPRLRHDAAR